MDKHLRILYAEIRRNQALGRVAAEAWQREHYLEVAEALTEAANALNLQQGRRQSLWSRLATRFGLFLDTLQE